MGRETNARRTRRKPGIDRASALVLLLGLVVIGLVLAVFRATTAREHDQTRSVLVVQHVGRELANAGLALYDAADSGLAVVPGAREIERGIARARGFLGEALGRGEVAEDFGRVRDDEVRGRMAQVDAAIARWAERVRAALGPTGSPAQRDAAAADVAFLRRRNTAVGELVQQRNAADRRQVVVLQGALVLVLAALFVGLAWQVARNRRVLAVRNRELSVRVEERTAQLSASEGRIRAVIDSALDAVVIIDGDGVVRGWNPRAEELLGVPRDEVVGSPTKDDLMPPELVAFHDEAMRTYARRRDPDAFNGRIEAVARRPDGREVPIEITVAATVAGGELIVSHFIRDITERLRAQAAVEAARDAAERAASAKSSFLATMSHEIRTPMNAIVGMTSLLDDTSLTPEQREYVGTVRTSGDALLAIINDILDFSKIESGTLELERHAFDLRDVIESALDLLAPQASAKGLDLGYLLETDGSTRLVGDSTRLRQVLINFLSNAVKFTARGAVTVHGRLAGAGAEDCAALRLEVRDTGIGIPADRLDRLFRSFSQVDASTTRRFGGTGLGLVISKRLVEAMDGRVEVSSVPGEGSTFALEVTLPRIPGADPVTAEVPQELRDRRVLVVDDNAVNRMLLERQLAAWSLSVESFERPQEALERVRAGERYDLALVDMEMPEMNGIVLADALSEATGFALPIVLLSSIGGVDPDVARGRLAATLSKPVKPATLRSALAGALSRPAEPTHRDATHPTLARAEQPLHVLVAEDNAVNQRVAVATLERLGHRADVAGDGLEALDALRRQAYDLVLMDMQMPHLDGLGATRRIRAELPPERQPRIVAMTANAFTDDREACREAGMDGFLAKPVERAELLAELAATAARGEERAARGVAPVLDRERLDAATGGDAEMAAMLAGLHAEEGATLVAQLRDAAARSDRDGLRAAAHTLTSSSASVGAMALSAAAADLQRLARAGDVPDAPARVERIAAELSASVEELRALQART